ncbi:hypothetical protein MOQ_004432 [Trypanosoma cruzi marinkellei]|uniref:Uncharacterized protein n=1 Tax=Trypanosoma cruzi marinkellei TaxID=85056 RepID=K2M9K0_TRYCR|nr:hypothetical protein MOQ_004432 [Trypanosoma cruzi marinkellei]
MESTLQTFLEAYPFRHPENPYEQTKAIWSKLAGWERESATGSFPSYCVQPIPLALLQEWKCYFAFCSRVIFYEMDWRDVFVYMGDVPKVETLSVPRDHVKADRKAWVELDADWEEGNGKKWLETMAGAYHRSVTALIHTLANGCERRFGAYPLRFHYQWLVRWTKMLAQCIRWRLLDVSKKGGFVPLEELQRYRLVFASRAREVVGAAAYIRTVLELLEMEEEKELSKTDSSLKGLPSLSLSQNVPLSLTFSMRFTLSRVTSVSIEQCFSAHSARVLDSLWADILCIPWDVLDPNGMPEKVRRKLVASLNNADGGTDEISALCGNGGCRMHSATLKAILENEPLERAEVANNPLLGIVKLTAAPLEFVEHHQLPNVKHLLETVGYVMLTKIRCHFIEKCYYTLPFLADFVAAGVLLKKALVSSSRVSADSTLSKEEESKVVLGMGLTPMLLRALLEATEDFYASCVDSLLHDYSKKAMKHFVEFSGGSTTVVVSQVTLKLLEVVVEPTLEVLFMLLSHASSSKEESLLIYFIADMLKSVLNEKMKEARRECKIGSRVLLQCRVDLLLLMNYIDEHPLMRRRISLM